MKQVIKYESDNGKLFNTAEEAGSEDKMTNFANFIYDHADYDIRSNSREIAELILKYFDLTPKAKKD